MIILVFFYFYNLERVVDPQPKFLKLFPNSNLVIFRRRLLMWTKSVLFYPVYSGWPRPVSTAARPSPSSPRPSGAKSRTPSRTPA